MTPRNLLGMILLCWASAAQAAPSVVPYAGYLTDGEGAPYEGSVDVQAALYACASAEDRSCPEALWIAEEMRDITVSGGVLRFELGSADDSSGLVDVLSGGEALWLDLAIRTEGSDTFTPLSPRHGLASVPYAVAAIEADNAEMLGGIAAFDYAQRTELQSYLTLDALAEMNLVSQEALAEVGYLTSEALADYVQSSALDDYVTQSSLTLTLTGDEEAGTKGYVHADNLDDLLAEYLTAQSYLDADAVTAYVTGVLGGNEAEGTEGYVQASELTTAIADNAYTDDAARAAVATVGYLLGDNKYTDDEAVAAVEAAGYQLEADRYTDNEAVLAVEVAGYQLEADKYTNEEAVAAVQAAGYQLEADRYTDDEAVLAVEVAGYAKTEQIPAIMKALALNQPGGLADAAEGPFFSTVTTTIAPGESLATLAVDMLVYYDLLYTPPDSTSPGAQGYQAYVSCSLTAERGDESEVFLSENVFEHWLYDEFTPVQNLRGTRSLKGYFSVPTEWQASGFELKSSCAPIRFPIAPSAGSQCALSARATVHVTTF